MAKTNNTVTRKAYIASYIKNGGVKYKACNDIGVSLSTVTKWLKDPKFVAELEEGQEQWYETLKANLMARAMKTSDTLGMFFLKAKYPEIYDDNVRKAVYFKKEGLEDPDKRSVTVLFADAESADKKRNELDDMPVQ